jgi:opacity protein-like surface antigen
VYGGGVEWMISSNFSVKAEGLWFNLSEETYQLGTAPISKIKLGPKPIEYDGVMFRIGGNYRF